MSQKPLPYQNKGDLTTGSIVHHLIRLTIPMIWGIFAVISIQLIDTYFISLLGTEALTGISFTFPVTMMISHLVFGINIAMSSVISRMIGSKQMDDAKRVVLHGIMMAFFASTTIAILCYTFLEPVFSLLGADETSMQVIKDYMPLWLIGSAILAIPVNGNSAIRAGGDAVTPAIIMTSIALINLILDPIFIFGYFGIPALGVTGAALATMIAYGIGTIFGLHALKNIKALLPHDGWHLDKFKDSIKRLIVIAIPAGITNIIGPMTNAVLIAILAGMNDAAVAAYGVATRIEAFALLLVISLSLGMSPIIGQNWGAEKYDRVHKTINTSILFNFGWSLGVALILALFGEMIARLFSHDEEVISYTTEVFMIVPISYAFANLAFGWASAFNAMGKPQRAFTIIFVKSIVITIPALYLGQYLYGVTGVFVALMLANFVSGAFFHILSWRACLTSEAERLKEQKA